MFIDSIDTFMLEHFIVGTWVRDSIVDGNLEGIRAPLQALNDNGYAHVVPGKWMAGITRLQAAARLTAEAQTLAQAAKGLAAIGRACGECHRDHGGPIAKHVPPDDSSPKTDSFEARMFRHAWAVERMWEGLTMPSESAWAAGAAALAQAPASAPRAPRHVPPEIARTLDSVRALGAKATHADTFEAREQAYAELLATCADCHHKHQQ